MLGKTSESDISDRLYDLIYELHEIAPNVLLAVLPQLEFKLKVGNMLIIHVSFYPVLLCHNLYLHMLLYIPEWR